MDRPTERWLMEARSTRLTPLKYRYKCLLDPAGDYNRSEKEIKEIYEDGKRGKRERNIRKTKRGKKRQQRKGRKGKERE